MKHLIFLALFLVGQVTAPAQRYKSILVQPPYICGAQYASRPLRVVVLGNSLAWSPEQPNFSWAQSNGMAATSLQTDYAHIICAALAERHHRSVALLVVQAWAIETAINTGAAWDRAYAEAINNFSPDVLIVQYSDNVVAPDPVARFGGVYNEVLDAIHLNALVCLGGWYQTQPALNAAIEDACAKRGGHYVPIVDIFLAPDMRGESFDTNINHGVGSHPNDLGHLEIARRVVNAIEGQ